jgi:hypothetical protein
LIWWLRLVGGLYVLNGLMMAIVRAPIRSAGPPGALDEAAAGEPTARFLVDTWIGFGSEVGAIGLALLIASSRPSSAATLVWTVIGIEVARGILYDLYMIGSGYPVLVYVPWLAVHTLVIVTGLLSLRAARTRTDAAVVG